MARYLIAWQLAAVLLALETTNGWHLCDAFLSFFFFSQILTQSDFPE